MVLLNRIIKKLNKIKPESTLNVFAAALVEILTNFFSWIRCIGERKKRKVPGNSKKNSSGYLRFVAKKAVDTCASWQKSGGYLRFVAKKRWIPAFRGKIPALADFLVLISFFFSKIVAVMCLNLRVGPKTLHYSTCYKLEEKTNLEKVPDSIFCKKNFNWLQKMRTYQNHEVHSFEKNAFYFFRDKNSSTDHCKYIRSIDVWS